MLEDINNILNSGDVPNLYKTEDYEPIFKIGKIICMEKNLMVTKMNMFSCYLTQVKLNIHMIIAMTPLSRSRLRNFPSIVNCCTIDWFFEWPEEALLGVGRGQILAEDLELEEALDGCVNMFKNIHKSVEEKSLEFKDQLNRQNYVTPTSFLELLATYATILRRKRKAINFSKNRLVGGLLVLEKAGVEIALLKDHIDKMTPELAVTKKDCMKKLDRAGKIIRGLAGEKDRWKMTVAKLTKDYSFLIGNCLVAAGMMAYSGAFTAKFRAELEELWRKQIEENGLIL
jgi:dynein heavy chain